MKILLLKPINDIYYVIQPNLGLGYLATMMLDEGHEVHLLNPGKERLDWDGFAEKVKDVEYDLIGIQMFTHELSSVKRHVDIIRRHSLESVVIVGGPHICGDPEGTMRSLEGIDFGFVGEAEIGVKKFMALKRDNYDDPETLKKIPNLVWRRGSEVMVNPREYFRDLDEVKFPAWHLMPPASYPTAPHKTFCKKTPVAPIIISRGCPFQCTFCAGRSVTGTAIRYRSVRNVIGEIVLLHDKYGVREIHIEDDNFTFQKEYVMNFCKEISNLKLDLAFALPNGTRLDTLDEEVVRLMEKTGFYSISFGIESGNDRVLKLMKKSLSKDIVKEKIDMLKACTDIELAGNFLIGYPGETEDEILDTISFAKSLKLDKAGFMFVMPLPGSELWDIYKERNGKMPDYGDFFSYRCVKGLSDIPADVLSRLYRKATREFYMRPRIIFGLIKRIKTYSQVRMIGRRLVNIFAHT